MIIWLSSDRGRTTMRSHLAGPLGQSLRRIVAVVSYREARPEAFPSRAACVLTDVGRLGRRDQQRQVRLAARLGELQHVAFNASCAADPLAMFSKLHEQGWNDFRVHPLHRAASVKSFPVFLKCLDGGEPRERRLLYSRRQLTQEVERITGRCCFGEGSHGVFRRLDRGVRLEQWGIVEFRDAADRHGRYKTYSAFIVDRSVIPRQLTFGDHWRRQSLPTLPRQFEEERGYVAENPHQAQLLVRAAALGLQYGRLDYAVVDNTIQVWRVATNPWITSPEDAQCSERREIHHRFAERFAAAVERLGCDLAALSRAA